MLYYQPLIYCIILFFAKRYSREKSVVFTAIKIIYSLK